MVLLNLKNYCRGALNKDYEKIVVIRERLSLPEILSESEMCVREGLSRGGETGQVAE